jgi:hypothetical protein
MTIGRLEALAEEDMTPRELKGSTERRRKDGSNRAVRDERQATMSM